MKPKVLIFIDWFLPGYQAGGPVTSVSNLISHLRTNFHFYIITRNTDYCDTKPYKGIESNCWVTFSNDVSVWYFSADSLNRKNLMCVAEEADCDVWYITGIYSLYFSILPAWFKRNGRKTKIIAPRGMLSPHALNVKPTKKKLFIFIARLLKLYRNSVFHATNEEEAASIRNLFPGSQVSTIPNLPRIAASDYRSISKKSMQLKLCNITRIAPEKNTLGALKILASLAQRMGSISNYSITYDIYGHLYNKDYWEECLIVISTLPPQIKVINHGSIVPQLIPDVLSESHFLFLPTNGENFGHAILESLSLGRPVIISDKTPWRNLRKKRGGWDIDLKDTDQFVEVLHQCLEMEQEGYDTLSEQSINIFLEEAMFEAALENYNKLFQQ